jgi:phospholipase C
MISGNTHGANIVRDVGNAATMVVEGSVIGDIRSALDDCVPTNLSTVTMSGKNIGDLLNAKGITWGWFQGGFKPTSRTADGNAVCGSSNPNIAGTQVTDYVPHHQPFQYFQSTANPHHLPPSSVATIGKTDQANHQYNWDDFWAAAFSGNLPAVSYLTGIRGWPPIEFRPAGRAGRCGSHTECASEPE